MYASRTKLSVNLIALSALSIGGCVSSLPTHAVRLHGADQELKPGAQGVFYSLPRTVVRASVPVIKTVETPGPYAAVAEAFFPNGSAITASSRSFSLGKIQLDSVGEPDPDQVFLIETRGGRFEDRKFSMSFSEDGIVDKIDLDATHKGTEFIGQVFKSAATIASRVINPVGGSATIAAPNTKVSRTPPPGSPCATITDDDSQRASCMGLPEAERPFYAALSSSERTFYTALPQRQRNGFRKYVNDADGESAKQQAKLLFGDATAAFNRIVKLQERRDNILGPSSIASGLESSYVMTILDRIDAEVAKLIKDFLGTKRTATAWSGLYEIRATHELASPSETATLLQFHETTGICSIKPTGTDHLLVTLTSETTPTASCAEHIDVTLTMGLAPGTQKQVSQVVAEKTEHSKRGKTGLFYRLPAVASVTVQRNTEVVATKSIPVAQLGAVVSLPPTTGGRRTHYDVVFHAETGALKNFTMDGEATAATALVGDVESAVTGVLDARTARRKGKLEQQEKEQTENSELEQLKREKELIEARTALIKAQKDYSKESDAP